MKRLCTICARGGSKGVAGKNIRPLAGKPLIAHSIAQARAAGLFELIAVSSDSDDILQAARQWGADEMVERPPELATDSAPKLPAIRHCVREVERRRASEFATIVDLDATSPLRTAADIQAAVALLEEGDTGNVITGMPARRSPYFNLVEVGDDGAVRLSKPLPEAIGRRQDAPRCYDMNASIYAWKRSVLFSRESLFGSDTRLYVMPEERSVDIDSELDWKFVEFIMGQHGAAAEGRP